jgi:transcriptional regulator with GAF, ATPase, and Fis domain
MALIAFSPTRPASHDDLHPFEQLAVGVSSSFTMLQAGDVDDTLARALREIAEAFGADECTLLTFGEHLPAQVVHSWAALPATAFGEDEVTGMPWLIQRLARNAVVAVTPLSEWPQAAAKDRAHAERTGLSARLAVPVVVGARVTYALMVASRRRSEVWQTVEIDRLRMVGELIGGGLERVRQEEALRVGRTKSAPFGAAPSRDKVAGEDARHADQADPIVGSSLALNEALARLTQVAPFDATVLLLGETGTGKELFARVLHERGPRRDQVLVRVNCAALPATLIESELFGHERGAFTGASAMRQGRFELADGGTIFLDEVGDLAPELQTKLLRVLQEGEFERVGSSKTRRVNVRVIAATHVDLEKAVADGRFRSDLYYRLSVFPIALPPLRDRPQDIPDLVWSLIHRRQRDVGRSITCVPASVMETLQQYDWPGNVRELENVIVRAMICSVDGTLQLDRPRAADLRSRRLESSSDTLDAVQRLHIERVLRECGGRINGVGNAAVRLAVHPNTLRSRIKKLGVIIPHRRGPSSGGEAA